MIHTSFWHIFIMVNENSGAALSKRFNSESPSDSEVIDVTFIIKAN